ncbi:MAG: LacI family transcriptional regulator [Bacteroidetes bacterium]|nr:LacI family transcriptional regulator [Bacteroidota bacterium]
MDQDKTIKLSDISKALNLSVSTISRALNDSHEIGEETKKRVQSYALKVNYRPNLIAQSLKDRNTRYIAIIVPEISNSFFAEVVNGVEYEANKKGYHVVIYQTHDSAEKEIDNIKAIAHRKADGLLMSPSTNQMQINEIIKHLEVKLPIVYFDRVPSDNYCHKVVCDNYQAAYEATSWLIKQGKRKIAHLAGPSGISISIERSAGYSAALLEAGISVDPGLIRYSNFLASEAMENFKYLEEKYQPDAYFASNDRFSLYCYEAVQLLPEPRASEVIIVGFTNSSISHLLRPKLIAIVQPAFEMGKIAAEMLLNTIAKNNKNVEYGFIKLPAVLKNI